MLIKGSNTNISMSANTDASNGAVNSLRWVCSDADHETEPTPESAGSNRHGHNVVPSRYVQGTSHGVVTRE